MIEPIRFNAQFDPCCQDYAVWLRRGNHAIEAVFEIEPIKPGEYRSPTLRLRPEEAQTLMDALWFAGLRPTGAKDPSGELAATKYHLEDMRRIAFKEER